MAKASNATGLEITFAAAAISSIQPVEASVRENPSVMAESSQVSGAQKRHAIRAWPGASTTSAREAQSANVDEAFRLPTRSAMELDAGLGEAHGGLSCRLSEMREFGDEASTEVR